jgi:hypothetical protein
MNTLVSLLSSAMNITERFIGDHLPSIGIVSIAAIATAYTELDLNGFSPEQNAQIACFCGTANEQTWGEPTSECDYSARVFDKAMWTATLRMCRYEGRPSVCIFHGVDEEEDYPLNSIEVRMYGDDAHKPDETSVPIGDSRVTVIEPGCTITPSW